MYRDRIVERDAAASSDDTPEVTRLATTPAIAADSVPSATEARESQAAPQIPADTITARGTSTATAANDAPSRGGSTNVQGAIDDPWIENAIAEGPSPIERDGWEALYVERVGLLAPAPVKIESEDEGFAYRLLGLTHWFGGGHFGVGGRLGYGSFSTVELSSRAGSTGLGEEITGTVTAKNRLWLEGHISWRTPLTRSLAVTLEGNIGGSAYHTKLAGDVVGTFFVTDNIGLHAGLGLGRYWYSIADERDRMLEDTPTGGVTSDVSSTYEGLMFEGRYGLFFRF